MKTSMITRNIRLYFLFELLREPLFWGAILITYIQRVSGMTLADIFFMESVCVIGLVILQVPTGMLADLFGRRLTIFIGSGFIAVQLIIISSATSPLGIWLANLIWVVGYSLADGADSSLIVDTLKSVNREDEYKIIAGRAIAWRLLAMALGALAAGYMAEINLRLPLIASSIFILANCAVAYLFVEPPRAKAENRGFKSYANFMKASILFVANHKEIKWIIGFLALISVVSKLWFFTYNPYFELVGLELRYFGWIFFGLNIIAAISSYYAGWISKRLSERASIIWIMLLIALPILIMGSWVMKAAALMVLSQNLVRGYFTPFTNQLMHCHLNSENRATVMSIKSAVCYLGQAIGLWLFGLALGLFPLPLCLQLLGLFMLAIGLFLFIAYGKIFSGGNNNGPAE